MDVNTGWEEGVQWHSWKITSKWINHSFCLFVGGGDVSHTEHGFQEKRAYILLTIWWMKHVKSHDFFCTHVFEVCNLCIHSLIWQDSVWNSYHPLHEKWQYWFPTIAFFFALLRRIVPRTTRNFLIECIEAQSISSLLEFTLDDRTVIIEFTFI